MRVTRDAGSGCSGVKWTVPFPAAKGLSSLANWACVTTLPGKKLQWSSNAAKYTRTPSCRNAGIL